MLYRPQMHLHSIRKDECARVRRAGARVLTLDQMEGLKPPNVDCWGTEEDDDGDPPRLWVPNGMFPGTAFTRSIGDAVAERIGVIAEPEVEVVTLTASSRFAVVASDGVFEFLSSQAVVDMIAPFKDPLEAALAVVQESYRLWLQYETRTDDITIIVIQFVGLAEALDKQTALEAAQAEAEAPMVAPKPMTAPMSATRPAVAPPAPPADPPSPVAAAAATALPAVLESPKPKPPLYPPSTPEGPASPKPPARLMTPLTGARPGTASRPLSASAQRPWSAGAGRDEAVPRPVRRSMAREKRSAITASLAADVDDGDAAAAAPAGPPLGSEDQDALAGALKACFLFTQLSDAQRASLVTRFRLRNVLAGEVVCRQGDTADAFFVVASGQFDVYLGEPPLASASPPPPHFTYEASGKGVHPSFGELALLYNQPRTASVVARTTGALWVLSRSAFRGAMRRADTRAVMRTLRGVEVLKSLSPGQLGLLADKLTDTTFKEGHVFMRQGWLEPDPSFYIIVEGTVQLAAPLLDSAGGLKQPPEQTVVTLGANQTFGERALMRGASAANSGTCVAVGGPVRCLVMSRNTFEDSLGTLAGLLQADRQWRERAAVHATTAASLPGVEALRSLKASDLGPVSTLWTCDIGRVGCARLAASEPDDRLTVTVRQVAISKAGHAGRQDSVMRERHLAGLIQAMPFIPPILHTFCDARWLTAVLQTSAVATPATAFTRPLSEKAAALYVAEAALALEHIHWHGALFRGLSPDTALLDAAGHLQLCDFRFAKHLTADDGGRTFTLCGHPEFLAPEQVHGAGHGEAADWWALGCFAYWLLTLHTPFGHPGEEAAPPTGQPHAPLTHSDELELYRRITGRQFSHPKSSTLFREVLDGLLTMNAVARPRMEWVQQRAWFGANGIDWDALNASVLTDGVPVPGDALDQVKAFTKAHPPGVASPAGDGDDGAGEVWNGDEWWEGWSTT